MRIRTYNTINHKSLDLLEKQGYKVAEDTQNPDAIILRSHKLTVDELDKNVCAIARAGAGVNNVPVSECSQRGIVVFNTPGANANSVKELVLSALFLSSRPVIQASNWVAQLQASPELDKTVEQQKKKFLGHEIAGKKLAIIGLGAIGIQVANAALDLGMQVKGYDPYISIEAAWKLHRGVIKADSLAALADCDYLTLHAPLNEETQGFIGEEFLQKVKPGLKLINFARAPLVDIHALQKALKDQRLSLYINDFPSSELLGEPQVISLPHLGASTREAEENCSKMAARQLHSFLQDGSIVNSVNLPSCSLPRSTDNVQRLSILNTNVPNIIGQVSTLLAQAGLNINEMVNQHHNGLAYNLIDTDQRPSKEALERIASIDGVLRLRSLPSEQRML